MTATLAHAHACASRHPASFSAGLTLLREAGAPSQAAP